MLSTLMKSMVIYEKLYKEKLMNYFPKPKKVTGLKKSAETQSFALQITKYHML